MTPGEYIILAFLSVSFANHSMEASDAPHKVRATLEMILAMVFLVNGLMGL